MRIETKCIQSGYKPENGEPRVLPIYQSTTFKYNSTEQMGRLFDLEESGYFYTRLANPTNDAVAAKIADLEGGVAAMLTSSGQAACFYSIFNICEAGDHFVCSSTVYGGTFNLFGVTMKKLGIDVTFVDPDTSEEELNKAFKSNTKAMFGETIANPALVVLDIEKFAKVAHEHGVPLIVDNTFATPINCRPFEWGADIVVHSTTKYMDGHATSVGGAIVDSGNFDWEANSERYPGLTTPDESYHGVVYTERFGKSAYKNDKISWVSFSGLENDKYHKLAQKYLPNGSCGVISFGVKGGRENAVKFMDGLKLAAIVTHVADARTSVLHPASHTHRQMNDEELKAAGVSPDLIRFSVGIENADDIIEDIQQSLDNI